MSETRDGGPAFPVSERDSLIHAGMSLRDYLAGQALAGMFANSPHLRALMDAKGGDVALAYVNMACTAYDMADAMLAERDRSPQLDGEA